jgi:predicted HAD superfamily Cof-like phosphohydrolase
MSTVAAVQGRDKVHFAPDAEAADGQPHRADASPNPQRFSQPSLDSSLLPVPSDATGRGVRRPASVVAQGATGSPHLSLAARAVIAFHAAFDLPRQPHPSVDVDESLVELRIRLLEEEAGEFARAARAGDLIALADALGDIVYVVYGTAVTYGLDLDAVVAEVHRANMSKLDATGRPILRDDGKVLKSDRYRPPNVARVIYEQTALPVG